MLQCVYWPSEIPFCRTYARYRFASFLKILTVGSTFRLAYRHKSGRHRKLTALLHLDSDLGSPLGL
ncbi:hypothetical protein BT96DRAFT_913344 [Gymnopus androsaceus JB14]|uniref:Uncharacterized protein n=1 Tax=Gymnopus androsaceus JB14 TaxID=1447944 RepID=A0A6A4IJK7_9AGAR|nr:hypothetical protein BT96DRAFT_913344 [Gymnopus androsaceus JB14]